jgi:serine/threonine protein kinase
VLGQGSFGKVTLCTHKLSKVKVAVKSIDKAGIKRTFTANSQVFEEMAIMEKLARESCPNLLELVETFEDDEAYYVVSNYMPGGDLYRYAFGNPSESDSCPLSEARSRSIVRDIAKGLKALHERRIIHRDIKFENVLMSNKTENATAFIADFGSSTQLRSSRDQADFMIGTPGFTAPEVLDGQKYGLKVDVWGLGALLYAMLTLELPFWSDDRKERKRLVIHKQLDLESSENVRKLSPEVKNLLAGMLEKNPKKRLSIEEVLAHPWFI